MKITFSVIIDGRHKRRNAEGKNDRARDRWKGRKAQSLLKRKESGGGERAPAKFSGTN